MDNTELLKFLILQLPNFLGLLIALYLLREQNIKLMELLRDCNKRNEDEEGELA